MKPKHRLPKYLNYFVCFFSILVQLGFAQSTKLSSNGSNPNYLIIQKRLESLGISEIELEEALRKQGLEIRKMNQEEIYAKKDVIEKAIRGLLPQGAKSSSLVRASGIEADSLAYVENEDLLLFQKPALSGLASKDTSLSMKPSLSPLRSAAFGLYGHSYFNSTHSESLLRSSHAPETVTLAPGDRIALSIFGRSQGEFILEVNAQGFVNPPSMPKILVEGLTWAKAKALITERFASFYAFQGSQITFSLISNKRIQIQVIGEVNQGGTFALPAFSTIFHALARAGGLNAQASVRNIQIIRDNKKIIWDLYAYLEDPSKDPIPILLQNDLVFIPLAEKVVSWSGAVKRPMRYELKRSEKMSDLIRYSGGFQSGNLGKWMQLHRLDLDQKQIKDIDLKSAFLNEELKDGDSLYVRAMAPDFRAFVRAEGAFLYPGDYDLSASPSLKTLLTKAQLKPEAFQAKAFVLRTTEDSSQHFLPILLGNFLSKNSHDFLLQNKDVLFVFEKKAFKDVAGFEVLGSVRAPYKLDLALEEEIRLGDALDRAGGTLPNSSEVAYVQEVNPFEPSKVNYRVMDLKKDLNLRLKPGSRVEVIDKDAFQQSFNLNIRGEVKEAKQLKFDASLDIRALILLAKGLNVGADLHRVDLFRKQLGPSGTWESEILALELDSNFQVLPPHQNLKLRPYDQVVIRLVPNFRTEGMVVLKGEFNYPGDYILSSNLNFFSDVFHHAGGLTSAADRQNLQLFRGKNNQGLVAFDLDLALKNPRNERFDPILLDGDTLISPKLNATIILQAAGLNWAATSELIQLSTIYLGPKSAAWYVRNFGGGFLPEADRNTLVVKKLNGQVLATKRFLGMRFYPKVNRGDQVSVQLKPQEAKEKPKPFDWDRFSTKLLAIASTLGVLTLYLNR